MSPATLCRQERIKSRKLIEMLFTGRNSRSFAVFPVRMVYMEMESSPQDVPVCMMVSVSKRHFKRAVKRNRVKRQVREAYRRNKWILTDAMANAGGSCKSYAISFIWQSDELFASDAVERSVVKLLGRLGDKIVRDRMSDANADTVQDRVGSEQVED